VSSGELGHDPRWLVRRAIGYGRPLRILASGEPTAVGSAILAAVAVGLCRDVEDGVARFVREGPVVEPGLPASSPHVGHVIAPPGDRAAVAARLAPLWPMLPAAEAAQASGSQGPGRRSGGAH
jgi:hypothetical protein